jgi:hypothetical protein
MVFWFFGKIWKNKNHTGFIGLGSGRKGCFHVVSISGAWHFFEYEQRPYLRPTLPKSTYKVGGMDTR